MASKTDGKKGNELVELIKTVVYALLIAGVIRTLLFQPFWIPSGSMKDTLLIGDFLFVNKYAYGYSRHSCPWSLCPFSGRILAKEPTRGDVIVFTHPDNGTVFIKRLVGLPGDRVQMKNGVLFINDEEAKQTPLEPFIEERRPQGPMANTPRCKSLVSRNGGECVKDRATESLPGGVTHNVLNINENSPSDDTLVFTVPEGEFFFMGDNRDNSSDSRYSRRSNGIGFVPFENIVGRADRVIFSSAGSSIFAFWTWRSDRFFKAVN